MHPLYPQNSSYPPKFRLHQSWEYKKILSANPRKRFAPIVVYGLDNNLNHSRLGITVRGAPNAVFRNYFKRITREIYRVMKNQLQSKDFNVVISISKSNQKKEDLNKTLGKMREQIKNELSRFLLPFE